MNENTTKLISELAQKLGTTNEYIMNTLTEKVRVEATVAFWASVFVFIVGILAYLASIALAKKDDTSAGAAGLCAVSFVFCAASFLVATHNLSQMISPHAYALTEVLLLISKH